MINKKPLLASTHLSRPYEHEKIYMPKGFELISPYFYEKIAFTTSGDMVRKRKLFPRVEFCIDAPREITEEVKTEIIMLVHFRGIHHLTEEDINDYDDEMKNLEESFPKNYFKAEFKKQNELQYSPKFRIIMKVHSSVAKIIPLIIEVEMIELAEEVFKRNHSRLH